MNPTSTYSKSRLIKELAFKAGIPQVKSRAVLEALRAIIGREAATAPFILPGICKFDTAMRKERRIRNPRTGEALVLPAHKVMRLTPSKSLRQAVAPRVAAVKAPPLAAETKVAEPEPQVASPASEPQVAPAAAASPVAPPPVVPVPSASVAEPVVATPAPEAPAAMPPPAAPSAPVVSSPSPEASAHEAPAPGTPVAADDFILPDLIREEPGAAPVQEAPPAEPEAPAKPEFTVAPNGDITFHCHSCGQEIEAPADMAGTDAECPMCGTPIHVPTPSGQASIATSQGQEVVSASEAEAIDPSALKNKTIRIDATELGFDDPAPAPKAPAGGDASGMISFFCPGCHQEIEATADMAGTTSECPNCGTEFEVPFFSEKGSVHAKQEELFDPRKANEQKHKTMRIDLDDF